MVQLYTHILNGINYIGESGGLVDGNIFIQRLRKLFMFNPLELQIEATSNDIIKEIDIISAILMVKKGIPWEEAKQRVYDVIIDFIFEEEGISIE